MTKGKQRTQEENQQRQLDIAHAAAGLIFKNGFSETSITQITKAAGIGKSTFYDYFSTKDEVILLLLDEPLAEIRTQAALIAKGDGNQFEIISKILHMHLKVLLRDKMFIFKLSFEFQRLPLEVQAKHEVNRQVYQDLLNKLIQKGIDNGLFRQVETDIVVKSLLSILSSVIITRRPSGTPAQMLDKALDVILNGIQNTNRSI